MYHQSTRPFLVVGSLPSSLVNFRGDLLADLSRHSPVVAAAGSHEMDIITERRITNIGATFVPLDLMRSSISPFSDIRFFFSLLRSVRRFRPRAFLGYTIKPVIYGLFAARFLNVPRRVVIISGLGYAFTPNRSTQRTVVRLITTTLYRLALRHAHVVCFQNPDDRDEFVDRRLVERNRTILIAGSGINLQRYSPTPLSIAPVCFLLIARLLYDKGILEFIEAARVVRRTAPNAQFRLVGPLDTNPSAIPESTIRSWVSEGLISWPGPVDDVRPEIAACHVYVLPSYREGTPRTVLEAMSMGRAVITTDAPGCRETVQDGVNGFLVPVRDVPSLAAAIERFVVDPSLAARMGAAGRQLAEEKFDVRGVNARIMAAMRIQPRRRHP